MSLLKAGYLATLLVGEFVSIPEDWKNYASF